MEFEAKLSCLFLTWKSIFSYISKSSHFVEFNLLPVSKRINNDRFQIDLDHKKSPDRWIFRCKSQKFPPPSSDNSTAGSLCGRRLSILAECILHTHTSLLRSNFITQKANHPQRKHLHLLSTRLLLNINMKFTTNALAAVAILAGVSVSSAQRAPINRLGRRALSIDGHRALANNMSYSSNIAATVSDIDGEPEYHHKGNNNNNNGNNGRGPKSSTSTSSSDDESLTFGARSPTLFGRSGLNVLEGKCRTYQYHMFSVVLSNIILLISYNI